jgi:hypothetical protein
MKKCYVELLCSNTKHKVSVYDMKKAYKIEKTHRNLPKIPAYE